MDTLNFKAIQCDQLDNFEEYKNVLFQTGVLTWFNYCDKFYPQCWVSYVMSEHDQQSMVCWYISS